MDEGVQVEVGVFVVVGVESAASIGVISGDGVVHQLQFSSCAEIDDRAAITIGAVTVKGAVDDVGLTATSCHR